MCFSRNICLTSSLRNWFLRSSLFLPGMFRVVRRNTNETRVAFETKRCPRKKRLVGFWFKKNTKSWISNHVRLRRRWFGFCDCVFCLPWFSIKQWFCVYVPCYFLVGRLIASRCTIFVQIISLKWAIVLTPVVSGIKGDYTTESYGVMKNQCKDPF